MNYLAKRASFDVTISLEQRYRIVLCAFKTILFILQSSKQQLKIEYNVVRWFLIGKEPILWWRRTRRVDVPIQFALWTKGVSTSGAHHLLVVDTLMIVTRWWQHAEKCLAPSLLAFLLFGRSSINDLLVIQRAHRFTTWTRTPQQFRVDCNFYLTTNWNSFVKYDKGRQYDEFERLKKYYQYSIAGVSRVGTCHWGLVVWPWLDRNPS